MRLTILGTGTVALSGARSCAGYFLEAGDVRLLVDCGSGTTRRLAELESEWWSITHVALSHFHVDHHGDLPTLVFAWKYGLLPPRSAAVEIHGPPGTGLLMERLTAAYGDWLSAPGFPLQVVENDRSSTRELAPGLRLSSFPVPHTPESVAYSIEYGGHRIVYTGDTGPSDALATWARGCDLLLCECSLPADMRIPEHLTPESCGELAASAGPRQLVLTHLYPPVERVDVRAIVAARYSGPVTVAHDGLTFEFEDA